MLHQITAVSRFAPLIGDEEDATSDGQERWQGHRRLTPNQILTLAANVVDEVKARGPFQSVAEFVNRQLVSDPLTGNSGALQTAIENSALNTDFGLSAPKNNSELTGSGFWKYLRRSRDSNHPSGSTQPSRTIAHCAWRHLPYPRLW